MLKEDALRNLGEDIRNMRKGMGMTLEKLAEALDTDFRVLSRYENGQAEMGAVMYRNLIQLYEQRTARADLLQQIKKTVSAKSAGTENYHFKSGRNLIHKKL